MKALMYGLGVLALAGGVTAVLYNTQPEVREEVDSAGKKIEAKVDEVKEEVKKDTAATDKDTAAADKDATATPARKATPAGPLTISSSAYGVATSIPARFTCEGEDVSPPLSWGGIPEGTQSLALVIDDPDAPDPAAPTKTVVHWIVYNIPPETTFFPQGIKELPAGAKAGKGDVKKTAYGGPCPPIGTHRYFHKIFALDTVLDFKDTPDKAELTKAMDGHILSQGMMFATYKKAKPGK